MDGGRNVEENDGEVEEYQDGEEEEDGTLGEKHQEVVVEVEVEMEVVEVEVVVVVVVVED